MVQRMRSSSDRLEALASSPFIAALALLVLNDFALKPLFHNAVTGKLSDFAGLFALALFFATLSPRHRRLAAWAIAAAFTFWKTRYAEPLIGWLNAISPFSLGRTVDLTDLVALPMIPLAVWAAPRLTPWPLPRALQVVLAVLAPLAFTATSRLSYAVRSTMDLSSAAVVDESALQSFIDEVADAHKLICQVCDPLGEGRVYQARTSMGNRPSLVVNFDGEQQSLFFATAGYEREGRRGVLAISEAIRGGMAERFPGATTLEFTDGLDDRAQSATEFTIRLPDGIPLSVDAAEQSKRTLSSVVEEVVRAHGLRIDENALVYYAGRRVGVSPYERDLVLTPAFVTNSLLNVRVVRLTESYAPLQRAVTEDLASRLETSFGSAAVTRQDFGTN
jgi:hypothetical protein